MSGGTSRNAARTPVNDFVTALASVMSPTCASAPLSANTFNLSTLRPNTRTFSPFSSNVLAITDPIFPVAPKIVYMVNLLPITSSSVFSIRSFSQTPPLPDTRHPRAAPRPFPGRSSAPVRCASPSPGYHPRKPPATHVASTRSPRRRRYGSTPSLPHLPCSPAHSATANRQSRRSHLSSLRSRDTVKPPIRNPDGLAQSLSAPSIRPWPPDRSAPAR